VTDAERAYAAGFFDGEGTVHVSATRVQVVYTNTNLALLRWVQVRWGGNIYKQTPHGLANTAHQVYSLRLNTLAGQAAHLRDIEPFLVAKTELVQNALVFADLKRRWRGKPPARELAALAQRHKELRGLPFELPEPKDWEQLDVFARSKADKP
jgi:hypothetical protein